jgi:hypothetical protein
MSKPGLSFLKFQIFIPINKKLDSVIKAKLRRFKMVSTVKSAPQTQPAAQPPPVTQKSTQSKPQPTTDTVKLSNAALVAAQEATETPTQTAKEAMSGDTQAQRLLAKEAAAKVAAQ